MKPAKQKKLGEIARIIEGKLSGDAACMIVGAARLDEAQVNEITFVASSQFLKKWEQSKASAFVVYADFPDTNRNVIRVAQPMQAFYKAAMLFSAEHRSLKPGVHPTAIVGEDTQIGQNVSIAPLAFIGNECRLGNNIRIYSGVVIADGVTIGDNSIIYQNVSIREDCRIGSNVIIHCGVVIGSDGFGFENVAGVYKKIPQLGNVVIEDDVEIGANCTIDRAVVGSTRIGKGTKLDNLIQVGHNVVIGENTVIAAQTGIAGSTKIGNAVIMGGQVGITGHIEIGDHVILGAQCGVTKSVPPKVMLSGYPARNHARAKREEAVIRKLPELHKAVKDMQKRIEKLFG
ncbi:UDP-3-O-(3-hydroxymyristoyl)glucosamine N-acyltransferase [candidate division KSB1 bacterium]|nr:UDP-3-O-(3-hydroxymyristoyl)glucosamine N-acyltransferase [candidate division KSB1 bacterium]